MCKLYKPKLTDGHNNNNDKQYLNVYNFQTQKILNHIFSV